MNFEENIAKIEEIISKLENGDIPLEEAVSLYKAGSELIGESKKELEKAKLTVSEYKTGEKHD